MPVVESGLYRSFAVAVDHPSPVAAAPTKAGGEKPLEADLELPVTFKVSMDQLILMGVRPGEPLMFATS